MELRSTHTRRPVFVRKLLRGHVDMIGSKVETYERPGCSLKLASGTANNLFVEGDWF